MVPPCLLPGIRRQLPLRSGIAGRQARAMTGSTAGAAPLASDCAVDERQRLGSRCRLGQRPDGRGGSGAWHAAICGKDRPARWLTASMVALGVLAGGSSGGQLLGAVPDGSRRQGRSARSPRWRPRSRTSPR